MFKKTRTLIAIFVVALFLGGAVPTQALDRDHDNDRKCEQRIRNAESEPAQCHPQARRAQPASGTEASPA